ncbi:MAG: hypothetical protein WBE93_24705 [Pseudolabrys sp.]
MNDNKACVFRSRNCGLAAGSSGGRLGFAPARATTTMLKPTLAERILKSAAQGERDRERLLDAALLEFTSEDA